MAIKNYLINDKWLDIDKQNIVEVKSTDGVIGSVKVNGEEYGDGSGGGGESDFSTAEVTVVNNTEVSFDWAFPSFIDDPEFHYSCGDVYITPSGSETFNVILYKGVAELRAPLQDAQISLSGDIEHDEGVYYLITGDCTITIS